MLRGASFACPSRRQEFLKSELHLVRSRGTTSGFHEVTWLSTPVDMCVESYIVVVNSDAEFENRRSERS